MDNVRYSLGMAHEKPSLNNNLLEVLHDRRNSVRICRPHSRSIAMHALNRLHFKRAHSLIFRLDQFRASRRKVNRPASHQAECVGIFETVNWKRGCVSGDTLHKDDVLTYNLLALFSNRSLSFSFSVSLMGFFPSGDRNFLHKSSTKKEEDKTKTSSAWNTSWQIELNQWPQRAHWTHRKFNQLLSLDSAVRWRD